MGHALVVFGQEQLDLVRADAPALGDDLAPPREAHVMLGPRHPRRARRRFERALVLVVGRHGDVRLVQQPEGAVPSGRSFRNTW